MAIAELLLAKAPPIREDSGGVLRIGDTRVSLDSVVAAYNSGSGAEEIVCLYPTLSLGEVHAAISFYLLNKDLVDEYIREGDTVGDRFQQEIEAHFPIAEVRARIMARQDRSRCSLK